MGNFTVSHDKCADFTVISNHFIDEYMSDANDAQLKIYLYLLRIVGSGKTASISDLADYFNFTEKDIMRALKYWEKKNLIALTYDESKVLKGLRILPLPTADTSQTVSVVPYPAVPATTMHLFTMPEETGTVSSKIAQENHSDPYKKPNYSLDELKAFKASETTSRLLFITEQYLKKTLSPNEMKTILFISDKLGFSEDLIDYLIQYCVGRDKKDLRYIEKVAINWAGSGITTPEQAAQYVNQYDKTVYAIMNALGKSNSPTATEVVFINRWTKEYGFDMDVILAACERTVLATEKHRFEYADKILSNWKAADVHHRADIEKLDTGYRKKSTSSKPISNQFNSFEQNQYDFDALERALLSNQ